MVRNNGLIFKDVPENYPEAGRHVAVEDRPFDLDSINLPDGGLLLRNHCHSFDPYQRWNMRESGTKSFLPAYEIGKPLLNSAVARVVKSANEKFKEGDAVYVDMKCPTEEYSVIEKVVADEFVSIIDNPYGLDEKMFLGALGMPGLTAYSGFYEVGKPKRGETIFVSAASGAVGQIVGQLAKHEGLHVIGSVGDDEKLKFIKEQLGFDGGFNYKKEDPADALKRLAPDGLDIYWENVGGAQLEASLDALNDHGRVVVCGMISQYNISKREDKYPIRNLDILFAKRIKLQGFVVGDADYGPKYTEEHQKNIQKWLHDGSFKAEMSVTKGWDKAADGLVGMFSGKNFGKAVLDVSE